MYLYLNKISATFVVAVASTGVHAMTTWYPVQGNSQTIEQMSINRDSSSGISTLELSNLVDGDNLLNIKRSYLFQTPDALEKRQAVKNAGKALINMPNLFKNNGWVFNQQYRLKEVSITEDNSDSHGVRLNIGEYVHILKSDFAVYTFQKEGDIWQPMNTMVTNLSLTKQESSAIKSDWFFTSKFDDITFDNSGLIKESVKRDKVYHYFHNNEGLLTEIQPLHDLSISMEYNEQNQLTSFTDQSGQITYYNYDQLDRLVSVILPDDTPETQFDNPKKHYLYQDESFPHLLTSALAPNGEVNYQAYYDHEAEELVTRRLPVKEIRSKVDDITTRISTWSDGLVIEKIPGELIEATKPNGEKVSGQSAVNKVRVEAKENGATIANIVYRTENSTCQSCIVFREINFDNNGYWQSITKKDNAGFQNVSQYNYNPVLGGTGKGLLRETTTRFGKLISDSLWTGDQSNNQQTELTVPGNTSYYSYDTQGRRIRTEVVDTTNALAEPRIFTFEYNSENLLTKVNQSQADIDDTISYQYNADGLITKITNALGHVVHYEYDDKNRRIAIVDENGLRTEMAYNSQGYLASRVVNAGTEQTIVTQYQYDYMGNVTKITLPTGQTINRTYNALGRLTRLSDNDGNAITYEYDANGNVIEGQIYDHQQQSIIQTSQQQFDELSRLTSTANGNLGLEYSNNNLSPAKIMSSSGVTTENQYDEYQRLIATTDALGGKTHYQYNDQNLITQVTDGRGVVTQYTYNGFGEKTSEQSGSKGLTTYAYDSAGNNIKETRAGGLIINRTFDALNRLTYVDFMQQTEQGEEQQKYIRYQYDHCENGIGRLCAVTGTDNQVNYAYNIQGNYTSVTNIVDNDAQVTQYQYNAQNQMTGVTYPSGLQVTYHYAQTGQINKVTAEHNNNSYVVADNITYRPMQNGLTQLTWGNGLTTDYAYNDKGLLVNIATQAHDTDNNVINSVQNLAYQYDMQGNITDIVRVDQQAETQTFGYDDLNRLTIETRGNKTQSYNYDAVGNRLSRDISVDNTNSENSYQYLASANQLTAINQQPLHYDERGNLIADNNGQRGFSYDVTNRLSGFYKNGKLMAEYTYNAFGQRVKKTLTRKLDSKDKYKTLRFDYLPNGWLLSERGYTKNNDKALTRDYIWLGGNPIAQIETSFKPNGSLKAQDIYFIHADHLNTPRVVTDKDQTIVWRWDSDAFGEQKADRNPDSKGNSKQVVIRLRFPGQYYDGESGLHYNHHRDYDPQLGRYIQSDPRGILLDFNDPQRTAAVDVGIDINRQINIGSLNSLYSYTMSNPVVFADETGEFWHVVAGALIGGVGNLTYQILVGDGSINWTEAAGAASAGAVLAFVPSSGTSLFIGGAQNTTFGVAGGLLTGTWTAITSGKEFYHGDYVSGDVCF